MIYLNSHQTCLPSIHPCTTQCRVLRLPKSLGLKRDACACTFQLHLEDKHRGTNVLWFLISSQIPRYGAYSFLIPSSICICQIGFHHPLICHFHHLSVVCTFGQGGRSWQPFSDSNNCQTNFRLSRVRYFRDKCVVFAHNCKLTNLIQCKMQDISCNSALHEQKTLLLTRKYLFCLK